MAHWDRPGLTAEQKREMSPLRSPQPPTARPPTASTIQATTPTGSHCPTIGWPRCEVRAIWWNQFGRLKAGDSRSMR